MADKEPENESVNQEPTQELELDIDEFLGLKEETPAKPEKQAETVTGDIPAAKADEEEDDEGEYGDGQDLRKLLAEQKKAWKSQSEAMKKEMAAAVEKAKKDALAIVQAEHLSQNKAKYAATMKKEGADLMEFIGRNKAKWDAYCASSPVIGGLPDDRTFGDRFKAAQKSGNSDSALALMRDFAGNHGFMTHKPKPAPFVNRQMTGGMVRSYEMTEGSEKDPLEDTLDKLKAGVIAKEDATQAIDKILAEAGMPSLGRRWKGDIAQD